MKNRRLARVVLCLVILCAGALTGSGQESNPNTEARLTNEQVLELVKAGISSEIIIEKIKRSRCNFDTDPTQLAELKYKGVPDDVLGAMIKAPYGRPSTIDPPPSPTPEVTTKAPSSTDSSAPAATPDPPRDSQGTSLVAVDNTGALVIQAGIVYRYGPPQPVARTDFVVLDDDPVSIITRAGIQGKKSWAMPRMGILESFIYMQQSGAWYDGPRALQTLKSHVLSGGTTDFNGNLVLTGLPAKRVYVFGYTQTRGGWAIWDVWVQIREGQTQSVVLDQNNAAISY